MVKISPDELSRPQSRAIGAHWDATQVSRIKVVGSARLRAGRDVGIFDFGAHATDVRFGSNADMTIMRRDVRFTPKSGNCQRFYEFTP
jgi:hypothetical protein